MLGRDLYRLCSREAKIVSSVHLHPPRALLDPREGNVPLLRQRAFTAKTSVAVGKRSVLQAEGSSNGHLTDP